MMKVAQILAFICGKLFEMCLKEDKGDVNVCKPQGINVCRYPSLRLRTHGVKAMFYQEV